MVMRARSQSQQPTRVCRRSGSRAVAAVKAVALLLSDSGIAVFKIGSDEGVSEGLDVRWDVDSFTINPTSRAVPRLTI